MYHYSGKILKKINAHQLKIWVAYGIFVLCLRQLLVRIRAILELALEGFL